MNRRTFLTSLFAGAVIGAVSAKACIEPPADPVTVQPPPVAPQPAKMAMKFTKQYDIIPDANQVRLDMHWDEGYYQTPQGMEDVRIAARALADRIDRDCLEACQAEYWYRRQNGLSMPEVRAMVAEREHLRRVELEMLNLMPRAPFILTRNNS